ncbi:hypothetical protein TanjilG_31598 [Lupinus angustifolius]|uniref:Uncharacterized protein n=1 Tax=Lupinus angustifolius TaxID=3871 RepID=A0A4P1RIP4_LUPAN|nr:PREDICTED: tumor necrosis factor ligand superfamily member 6 [Lupinus angustifolius]OIW11848.1 hypothetical protein TanjilG_31598 [Lupinus angustifolius]
MSETPKLFTNKPRKEQLKQFRGQHKPSSMPTYTAPPPPPPPPSTPPSPPPQPPKESFARRYKFLWPMLLAVNLGVGVYLFMRTKNKDTSEEEKDPSPKVATAHIAATSVSSTPITNPVIKREPIPKDQQLELFKWILEEKRKVKPKDAEEKRQIDEEKALLKKYIRSKSIPRI